MPRDHLPPAPPGQTGWPWSPPGEAAGSGPALPDAPLVSIVTPSYNQAEFIEATIRSVLLQDHAPLEYIVVDGGSTDGTLDILRRYAAWLTWTSEPDGGQAEAINKGLRRARGEVLAYLNSDDLYLPGAIARAVSCLRGQPQAGLVYGDCDVIDEAGRTVGRLRAPGPAQSLSRMIARGEYIPQPAAFWRRAVVERAGLFDESLHLALDYDFFIRAGRVMPVAYLPQPLAAFRLHGGSKTVSREERHWREALRVSSRHGLRPWHAWWWLRRLRHWGLRALPAGAQRWARRRLGRAQDDYLARGPGR